MVLSRVNRGTAHRWALFRTMVTQLIKHERIRTTQCKARQLSPIADKMVTLAKEGTLHARRQANAFIREDLMVQKLFYDFPERYKARAGGYTRVMLDGYRKGDGSPMAIVEFVDRGKGPVTPLPEHGSIPKTVRDRSLSAQPKAETPEAPAA
eukprot:TRINITY_DN13501_c0_g1_i1.p1 TRINITY_DN13501_c0_g1~~TRINITY_DN13501_c0_g1_i1.p1  ORF type:complete len:152 (+),score=12.45 TRINITY_DN13501_c0_g1_i1:20-475(+)